MSEIDYQALREAAEAIKVVATPQKLLAFRMKVTPQVVLALLDERERNQQYIKRRDQENEDIALTVGRLRVEMEAAEKRIAELSASHRKLRNTMAGIHNTIRMDGGYTPLAAILNAAKRAYEESASAAGIRIKGE
ncbi:ead/Ea22-like family protein [Salmonella enterica]|nr:ead/Ea22-like family protein [Salmonella enterica subsp. enterica serovar Ruiru]EAO6096662.1 ead/Ea22-like family protein [Salmonella enterica]EDT6813507.1 ead/Ea22-like family protein [Salmonella enterica subsp. enterica]EED8589962.1 ead/Ea22-like family protein [Salmonella enterica subsp. enterica serovar Havana]EBG0501604.1 ead/Ea22-like family protein [Salmonella enterica subsp. enterica serovar Ruiru]